MEPIQVNPVKLKKIAELLKIADETAIGTYLFKNLRIQISKYKSSGSERFARLYKKRRDNGLCVICAEKVSTKNPKTGKLYRLCDIHRTQIDKKNN
jgi:hypothetical protein